jgi:hypothetical protein
MALASRIAAAGLLLLVALMLYRSRELAWGGADAPDGTRYKVSPVGISHVLNLMQTVSPTEDCRWGSAPPPGTLCAVAPGGASAFRYLRLVPALLAGAAVLSLASAVALFPAGRTAWWVRAVFLAAASLVAVAAPVVFDASAPGALASLQGLTFGTGGTLGTLQVSLAAAFLAGLAVAHVLALEPRMRRIRWPVSAMVIVPAVGAFLEMFPLLGGQAFALGALTLGLLAGRSAKRPTET